MKRRRVVITGLGVIAPNGIGKDAFWSSLLAGKSAVDYVKSFDVSPYLCKVAAEVRQFYPKEFISAKTVKTAARFSQFAVAASRLALDDAKLSIGSSLGADIAICYGTSVSGVGDVADEAAQTLYGHR